MSKPKQYAEIQGLMWEANFPWCCGCPEFISRSGCAYEGNGCRYPDERTKRPISFAAAYREITKRLNKDCVKYGEELGSCIGG